MRTFSRKPDAPVPNDGNLHAALPRNEGAEEIIQHFGAMAGAPDAEVGTDFSAKPADAEVPDYGDITWPELCEEQLREFYEVHKKAKELASLEKELRAQLIKNLKQQRGSIMQGEYVVTAKETAGRRNTDWDKFKERMVDLIGKDDVATAEKEFTTEGQPILKVEVGKLSVSKGDRS